MTLKTPEKGLFPIIFDNTVLSNFALVQQLGILQRLYCGRAFVCRAVLKELQNEIASSRGKFHHQKRSRLMAIHSAIKEGWLAEPNQEVNPDNGTKEIRLAIKYEKRFGSGEAESMALAVTRRWVFASDDRRARDFAQSQGIKLTGTLGILVKATNLELITTALANTLHAQMIDEGYHSPLPYKNGISTFLNGNG